MNYVGIDWGYERAGRSGRVRRLPEVLLPDGRQGLLSCGELFDPRDLSRTHGEQPSFPDLVEVHAAALAAPAPAERSEDLLLADRDEFLVLKPHVLHHFVEAGHELADSLVSAVELGVREIRPDLPFDLGCEEIQDGNHPGSFPRPERRPDDLHVSL